MGFLVGAASLCGRASGEEGSLSHLMGHTSVKLTEIYLEDSKSRQARVQHAKFSPISGPKLRQRGTGETHLQP